MTEGSQKGLLPLENTASSRKKEGRDGTRRQPAETRPCVAFQDAPRNTCVLKRQASPDNGGSACGFRGDAFFGIKQWMKLQKKGWHSNLTENMKPPNVNSHGSRDRISHGDGNAAPHKCYQDFQVFSPQSNKTEAYHLSRVVI